MSEIQKYEGSDIRTEITEAFLNASERATVIRTWVFNKGSGTIISEWNEFVSYLGLLVDLSEDIKDLNKKTIESVNEWLIQEHDCYDLNDVKEGIEMFKTYKSELFRKDVLRFE